MKERGKGIPRSDIERAREHFPHATFGKDNEYVRTMLETGELVLPARGTGFSRGTAAGNPGTGVGLGALMVIGLLIWAVTRRR